MTDIVEERRAECKQAHSKIESLWNWFQGNGNPGAGSRLTEIEDTIHGKEDCLPMTKMKEHLDWHEKMAGKRWELYIGFILVILSQVLSSIFLGG